MWRVRLLFVILASLTIGCTTPDKGCHIDGMITDFGDDDGCVSPGARYCVTPGLVYMPNTGDGDNCQSPRSYCEGNPFDPNC